MIPKYPIFIPTKGRWESRLTIKALDAIGAPYKAVIEEQEYDNYAAVMDESKLLVMPQHDSGLVVTRNWIWDHAESIGAERFWTFDDNIRGFIRYNSNIKASLKTSAFLCAIEDFAGRYNNLPIIGMNYEFFVCRRAIFPKLVINTRVYSNMLIETCFKDPRGKSYRNEGFYNDDTDLCLRVLKDGNCVVQTNAFLINKQTTMTVKGGMTPYYQGDGRWKMANELRCKHPDVVTIVRKWGRWQHQVDYRPFRNNRLKLKPGCEPAKGVNNYGMKLMGDPGNV